MIHYVIVNNNTKQLVKSFEWFGQCDDAFQQLQPIGEYSWYNITHPKVPEWVKNLVQLH